jgi:transcription antitermination factor NusG
VIAKLRESEHPDIGCHIDVAPRFVCGDVVELVEGPLAGLEAVFEQPIGERRAMILLECLGRENRIPVDIDLVARTAVR